MSLADLAVVGGSQAVAPLLHPSGIPGLPSGSHLDLVLLFAGYGEAGDQLLPTVLEHVGEHVGLLASDAVVWVFRRGAGSIRGALLYACFACRWCARPFAVEVE